MDKFNKYVEEIIKPFIEIGKRADLTDVSTYEAIHDYFVEENYEVEKHFIYCDSYIYYFIEIISHHNFKSKVLISLRIVAVSTNYRGRNEETDRMEYYFNLLDERFTTINDFEVLCNTLET